MPDEKKSLKFQMMMSPSEAGVLDDWMFHNRIRSRAEAIRRLCQIGLILDGASEEISGLAENVKDLVADLPHASRFASTEEGASLYLLSHQLFILATTLAAAAGTLKENDDSSLAAVNERKDRILKSYKAASEVLKEKGPKPA